VSQPQANMFPMCRPVGEGGKVPCLGRRYDCDGARLARSSGVVECAVVECAVVECAVAECAVAECAVAECAVAECAVAECAVVEWCLCCCHG
jgi:hypothetical protein